VLISEIKGWRYYISWDNPVPADSSAMLEALSKFGKLAKIHTKTSHVLSPKSWVRPRHVRQAIKHNLHPSKGNAFYVNMRTGKAFHIGKKTKMHWKRIPQ
jgi:hypothetical protein